MQFQVKVGQSCMFKVISDNSTPINPCFLFSAPSIPTDVRLSQVGLNTLEITWLPPSEYPLPTGYIVQYHGYDYGVIEAEANENTITISGLDRRSSYQISLVAKSTTLPSLVSDWVNVTLGRLLVVYWQMNLYQSCHLFLCEFSLLVACPRAIL